MDEKTIQRIKKLQALAERGVGGEKETAAKMLQRLLEKNGISTLEELEKEEIEYFLFSYNGRHEIKLALLKSCDFVIVGGKYGISEGMRREIETADKLGIPVVNAERLEEVRKQIDKLREQAANDYAKMNSCKFCKGSRLHTCTGYSCKEPYQRAYDYAMSELAAGCMVVKIE